MSALKKTITNKDDPVKEAPKPKRAKTGGRKKGSVNKNAFMVRQALNELDVDIVKEIIDLTRSINDPKLKLDALLQLLKYAYPQMNPVDAPSIIDELEVASASTEDDSTEAIIMRLNAQPDQ